jgi:hypothetical protein
MVVCGTFMFHGVFAATVTIPLASILNGPVVTGVTFVLLLLQRSV